MKETIKANDLRIGNLVLDRGNKILTIDRFWGNKIECDIKGMPDKSESGIQVYLHQFTEDIDYLIPIPLTEEWLLKLGLNKIAIWTFSLHLVGNLELIYYSGEKGWSIGLKNYSDFSNLKYVHQIQNLYFALTGKELTVKQQ